jgi:hypothetical protein
MRCFYSFDCGSAGRVYGAVEKSDGDAELFRLLTEVSIYSICLGVCSSGVICVCGSQTRGPSDAADISGGAPTEASLTNAAPAVRGHRASLLDATASSEGAAESGDEYSDEDFDDADIEKEIKSAPAVSKISAGGTTAAVMRASPLTAPKAMSESVEESLVRVAAANAVATAEEKERASAASQSKAEMERRRSEVIQRWFSQSAQQVATPPAASPSTESGSADSPTASPSNAISSEAAVAGGSQVIRPSPLVASQSSKVKTAPAEAESGADDATASAAVADEETGDDSARPSQSREESSSAGYSEPPSPPSSSAPSAAASLEQPPAARSRDGAFLIGGSVGTSFQSVASGSAAALFSSVEQDEPRVGASLEGGPMKARVSFDLNRNTTHDLGQAAAQPVAPPSTRPAAYMSVDSLDVAGGQTAGRHHPPSDREKANPAHAAQSAAPQYARYPEDSRDDDDDGDDYSDAASRSRGEYQGDLDRGYHPPADADWSSGRGERLDRGRGYRAGGGVPDASSQPSRAAAHAEESASSYSGAALRYSDPTSSWSHKQGRQDYVEPSTTRAAPPREAEPLKELTLDVVAPSIDELHAQLAMIKAAERRRREGRVDRSGDRGSWNQAYASKGRRSPRGVPVSGPPEHRVSVGAVIPKSELDREMRSRSSSPPPPPLPSAAPEWDSLSRIEQTNARLNRQFEELNKEIQLLRSSSSKPTPPRVPLQNRIDQRQRKGAADEHGGPAAAASGSASQGARRPLQSWDADALSAVKDILRESEDLRLKVCAAFNNSSVVYMFVYVTIFSM